MEQFTFYELYADILQSTDDVSAGKLASCICAYEFEDREPDGEMTNKEHFYWSNIADILREVKETESAGKIPKKYNLQSRHFTFYETYYNAMKLLNVRKRGIFVKAVCAYMFKNEEPRFTDRMMQGYFNLCMRKLDLSRKRKKSGHAGGKSKSADTKSEVKHTEDTEEISPTPQDMPQLMPMEEQSESTQGMTYEQFRNAHTDIQEALYGSSERYITDLDWADVAAKFAADEELNEARNIYYLARNYEQKYGQIGKANRVAKWDDLNDNL